MKQRSMWPAVLVVALIMAGCGSATGKDSNSGGTSGKLVVWDWKSSDKNAANFVAKHEKEQVARLIAGKDSCIDCHGPAHKPGEGAGEQKQASR